MLSIQEIESIECPPPKCNRTQAMELAKANITCEKDNVLARREVAT